MSMNSWLRGLTSKPKLQQTGSARRGVVAKAGAAGFRPQLEALEVRYLLSAGQLDPTFGSGGQVITSLSGFDRVEGIRILGDGNIIAAGESVVGPGFGAFSLAHYRPDGSLDSTFGVNGAVTNSLGAGARVRRVAFQPDGKVLAVGDGLSGAFHPTLFRFNADGTVDPSFGIGGQVTSLFGPSATPNGLAVQADGKIIEVGVVNNEANHTLVDFAVARRNLDGSLDSSFGTGGVVLTDIASNVFETADDFPTTVALQCDGKIVVAGESGRSLSFSAIVRYNTDGTLDSGFGAGGKVTFELGSSAQSQAIHSIGFQADGKIVVAGTTVASAALARLNRDGSLDSSFGRAGQVTTFFVSPSGANIPEEISNVLVRPDGRILVTGTAGSDFFVTRYKADGELDQTFGQAGMVVTNLGADDHANSAVLQADGRLLVAGFAADDQTRLNSFALARYLGDDRGVEASSITLAADLQAAVHSLDTTTPIGTPRVVLHMADPARMPVVASALANLVVDPAGPVIEILLAADSGSYSLGRISVPTGLRLIIDGDGGFWQQSTGQDIVLPAMVLVNAGDGGPNRAGIFTGSSSPALTLVSGDVLIRNGAIFTGTGNAQTIRVQGGHLTVRNSTIEETPTGNQAAISITGGLVDLGSGTLLDLVGNTIDVHGTGLLIRNTGPNDVLALGNTFLKDGKAFADNFRIEDAIDHAMDGLEGGTVVWVADNVFVSANHGRIQRGVDLVPDGGIVNVEAGVPGNFSVGTKLLTINFQDGSSMIQQADTLDPSRRSLVLMGTYANDTIKFVEGDDESVRVEMNNLPTGTFRPNARLIAYGVDGSDNLAVSDDVHLSAWLFGGFSGNNRLQGGGGNDVLIGGIGDDTLIAGGGRDLLIGDGGADHLDCRSGDDILIGGYWAFGGAGGVDETAVAAIMAEWTSGHDYTTRVNNLVNGGGLNGDYTLSPDNTVYDDGAVNVLEGGAGRDLYFASLIDVITGRRANETVSFV
jgi:uncharacterized delta-60 repeat protein